jgi:hypothetical protein
MFENSMEITTENDQKTKAVGVLSGIIELLVYIHLSSYASQPMLRISHKIFGTLPL